MKKKIYLRRILHREKQRIAIFFDYDKEIITMIRSVRDIAYSGTNKCFYLDDNEDNLKLLLRTFRDGFDIDISALSSPSENRKLAVKDEEKVVPPQPVTIMKIDGRPVARKRTREVIFTINEEAGLLLIRFPGGYEKEWINEIKTYGRPVYDKFTKEWSVRWSRIAVDSLSDHFSRLGLVVTARRSETPVEIKEKRETQAEGLRKREFGSAAMEGIDNVTLFMREKRYSNNSIESYTSHLGTFFRYFAHKDPGEISADDVSMFFSDFVTTNKYSASYQNQMISAIKLYYSVNPGELWESFSTGRPRRSRSLPKVFSKEEVTSILNSTRNLKHRLILWMIYSCGLRRGEVINIKIRDLDRHRGVLNIIQGKGMIDRVVPVSAKVWEKIDEYVESYKPSLWLFEGQTTGRYSSESVYRIFKEALRKAGIKKEVGVHSLRHSFATHLHENGLDIRYIQELLGHKSTRTTEIYTHVSRRNLLQVKSPIDDLDLR